MAQRLHAHPLPLTTLSAGAVLMRQGDPCARAWTIRSGVMIERMVSSDGRVLIPRLPGPGDLVGGLDTEFSPVTVVALRRTSMRPAIGRALEQGLAARNAEALALAAEIAWLDTTSAIERRLRLIAERYGRPVPGGTALGLTLTQEDLGAFVGTTRETANRAVRELMSRGAIGRVARGRYVVAPMLRAVR